METVRVLIVDDEEELVSALTERLQLRGFIAAGVTHGVAALDRMARESWDVVLVDIRMPGIGGLELTARIRADHPETEVVLLTGRTAPEDDEAAHAVGARTLLSKPVAIEVLEQVLKDAADRRVES